MRKKTKILSLARWPFVSLCRRRRSEVLQGEMEYGRRRMPAAVQALPLRK